MKKDDKPRDPTQDPLQRPKVDADKPGNSPADEQPQEPFFADFDDEEDYEEPDRDTDHASAYRDDEAADGDFPEAPEGGRIDVPSDWPLSETDDDWQDADALDEDSDSWTLLEPATDRPETDAVSAWQDAAPLLAPAAQAESLDEEYSEENDEDWDEGNEDYEELEDLGDQEDLEDLEDQEYFDEQEERAQGWPLGLIAVALVALLLLAAGGYGVIQQRSAMEEEIRQLQASLATAANPAEVSASREALLEMEQRNMDQLAAIDGLSLENRRLKDIVKGLESQLEAQQAAASKPAAPRPTAPKPAAAKPTPEPVTAAAPVAKPAASAPVAGAWFVNFGTYSQRAAAETWAAKLRPSAGEVVVATAAKDGASFYRVRVTGLTSSAQAQKVSRELEAKYGLPKLWVGKQ